MILEFQENKNMKQEVLSNWCKSLRQAVSSTDLRCIYSVMIVDMIYMQKKERKARIEENSVEQMLDYE